jgi:ParB-like chromosome segregation protein Spo0J
MTIPVHPAADIFPMMADDELQALADDIKANGLRNPIVLTADGDLLDGRNRQAACDLAKVKPDYLTVNGDDPVALVVSLNVKRRNLTAGQRAMAAAEACLILNAGVRGLAAQFGVSSGYISQARQLLDRDPPAAAAVKSGDQTLGAAHEALRKREGKTKGAAGDRRRLREAHPDLAEQVDAEVLELEQALEKARAREAQAKQQRASFTTNVIEGVGAFGRDPAQADELAAMFDPDIAAHIGHTITPDNLRRVAAFAGALADAMERTDDQAPRLRSVG